MGRLNRADRAQAAALQSQRELSQRRRARASRCFLRRHWLTRGELTTTSSGRSPLLLLRSRSQSASSALRKGGGRRHERPPPLRPLESEGDRRSIADSESREPPISRQNAKPHSTSSSSKSCASTATKSASRSSVSAPARRVGMPTALSRVSRR